MQVKIWMNIILLKIFEPIKNREREKVSDCRVTKNAGCLKTFQDSDQRRATSAEKAMWKRKYFT